MKLYLLVLDSVGIGGATDAGLYGDEGASTLAHTAQAVGGLHLPVLQSLGLGNIPALTDGLVIAGVAPVDSPRAAYGAMEEQSTGKDTTTGHWEIAGLCLEKGLRLFPPGPPAFPPELMDALSAKTGRGILGNKAASGTAIIDELGSQQMRSGDWIVYTSADSVVQIAAHEEVIPLETLYDACAYVRELCNPLSVGRVIARPYLGKPGHFKRTDNRRDFSLPLPEPSVLAHLAAHGIEVCTVGKLDDIFPDSGISRSFHVENTPDAMKAMMQMASENATHGLVFANFIDFDMRYGHRRDASGYATALEETDQFLAGFLPRMAADDILIITADHGNDPTFPGSDHTRERVPLLVVGSRIQCVSLGLRHGFYDVAQSVASAFGIPKLQRGVSFL